MNYAALAKIPRWPMCLLRAVCDPLLGLALQRYGHEVQKDPQRKRRMDPESHLCNSCVKFWSLQLPGYLSTSGERVRDLLWELQHPFCKTIPFADRAPYNCISSRSSLLHSYECNQIVSGTLFRSPFE